MAVNPCAQVQDLPAAGDVNAATQKLHARNIFFVAGKEAPGPAGPVQVILRGRDGCLRVLKGWGTGNRAWEASGLLRSTGGWCGVEVGVLEKVSGRWRWWRGVWSLWAPGVPAGPEASEGSTVVGRVLNRDGGVSWSGQAPGGCGAVTLRTSLVW